jgi:hypothetical protein
MVTGMNQLPAKEFAPRYGLSIREVVAELSGEPIGIEPAWRVLQMVVQVRFTGAPTIAAGCKPLAPGYSVPDVDDQRARHQVREHGEFIVSVVDHEKVSRRLGTALTRDVLGDAVLQGDNDAITGGKNRSSVAVVLIVASSGPSVRLAGREGPDGI